MSTALRELAPGQVDVWYAYQNGADITNLLDTYLRIITAEELEAVERFRFSHLRRQALVARSLQRWVLSQYVPVQPAEWRFGKGPYGKPIVETPEVACPSFNLSHSGEMIACAVSWTKHVGVDIEDVTRELPITDLAGRYFAPTEAYDVTRQSAPTMRYRFYRYWTLKEAFVKAIGRGLSQSLDSFAFELRHGVPPLISFAGGESTDAWQFGEISFPGRYHVSIAADTGTHELRTVAREVVPFGEIASTAIECCNGNHWFAVAGG